MPIANYPFLFTLQTFACPLPLFCNLSVPYINATSAVLLDSSTGRLIYSKNPNLVLAPASTTKIMTAILALEKESLSKMELISPAAAAKEGSSMYLVNKEQRSLKDLLYGLLLVSGNDAATAIAESVSGTEGKFAQLMNQENTQFKNASGLPAIGHYSTAYDLAILTKYALKNPSIAKIISTKVKVIPGAKPGTTRRLINHNKLLWNDPIITGVKTGYTITAGGCLVASATYNNKVALQSF